MLSAVFLLTTVGYLSQKMYTELRQTNNKMLLASNNEGRTKVESEIEEVLNDLKTLSAQMISKNLEIELKDTADYQKNLEILTDAFITSMKPHDIYDQLRFLDTQGQELIRINRNKYKNEPTIVGKEGLQNKSDRDYFLEGIKLREGQIHVNDVNLNREGQPAKIEVPHKPVIQYSIPVFSNTNQLNGLIVANIRFNHVIEDISLNLKTLSEHYIVDEKGYYLNHPDPEKTFGSPNDLNTGYNILNDIEKIESIFEKKQDLITIEGNIYSSTQIKYNPYNPEKFWLYIESASENELFAGLKKNVRWVLFIGLLSFLILFELLSLGIIRMLYPLKRLAKAAEEIGAGNFDKPIDVNSKDEIGQLGSSLKKMKKKLKNLYGNLEKKVKLKTKELESKVNELQKSKLAMINIANDLNIEREEMLHERDKLNTVLQNIGDGVFVIDKHLNIIIFNKAASLISGVKTEKAMGKNYKKILKFQDEKTGKSDPFIDNVFKSKDIQEMGNNTVLLRKNRAQIPVADSAAPLKNSKGEVIGVIVVFRDVTKERSVDKAKTEFVSLASHQLRTPLTSINWYTEMLLAGDAGKISKQQKEYLKEIYGGNQTMLTLVNSLLNVSRIDLGTFMIEPESTDIIKLCKSVIKEMKPTLMGKNQKVTEKFEKNFPNVDVDVNLMRIVLQNYISNAAKYTPEKGKITIGISQVKAGKEFKGKTMRMDSFVFYVSDTGYGIPEEQHHKIFQKLFRADNVRALQTEGTGLGLYVIKSIVESSKGSVWFDSKEEKGSTFYAALPMTGMIRKEGQKGLS